MYFTKDMVKNIILQTCLIPLLALYCFWVSIFKILLLCKQEVCLQGSNIKVISEQPSSFSHRRCRSAKSLWLCPALCDPLDCSPPGSSPPGFRQEHWIGLSFPPPGDLPHPGIEPGISSVSCVGRRGFYHWHHLGSPSHGVCILRSAFCDFHLTDSGDLAVSMVFQFGMLRTFSTEATYFFLGSKETVTAVGLPWWPGGQESPLPMQRT